MNLTLETGVPVLTVFLQGLLSFLSPCVLPLLPVYISYLAGGADSPEEHRQRRITVNTIFFVIGISFAFFVLGLGVTALGRFFTDSRIWITRIGGILMILFGLYQLGVFGHSGTLDTERRLPFNLDRWTMGPVPALLLGFTFSFAWTPCIGPVLTGVLLMAGTASTQAAGFALIGVYTLGFVLPFLLLGFFTGKVLDFFQKRRNFVRYTVKIAAVLLIIMGTMMLTGWMNNITGYLSGNETESVQSADSSQADNADSQNASDSGSAGSSESSASQSQSSARSAAPDFTLQDQYGNTVTLSDYQGKTVFLNFWATWCPPCRNEMPEIQQLYESYGENGGDVIILGIAAPNYGQEGSVSDIKEFLGDNGYTFPVVMNSGGSLYSDYGISSFPTTIMIDSSGNVYGRAVGGLSYNQMESIIKQTQAG